MVKKQHDYLSIKTASSLSGVSDHTIRAWERRYSGLSPKRTKSGQRSYSMEHVERLKLLGVLVSQGFMIGRIASLDTQELERLLKPRPDSARTEHSSESSPLLAIQKTARQLLRTFELEKLDQQLTYARTLLGARLFALKVASPLLQTLEEEISCERLGVGQEHAISAMLRHHLGHAYRVLSGGTRGKARSAVFSTPQGDLHEFGILISAILWACRGWETSYLGPNLPASELAKFCRGLKPNFVVLGTSAGASPLIKEPFGNYIEQLDRLLPANITLIAGGALCHQAVCRKRRTLLLPTLEALDEKLNEFQGEK